MIVDTKEKDALEPSPKLQMKTQFSKSLSNKESIDMALFDIINMKEEVNKEFYNAVFDSTFEYPKSYFDTCCKNPNFTLAQLEIENIKSTPVIFLMLSYLVDQQNILNSREKEKVDEKESVVRYKNLYNATLSLFENVKIPPTEYDTRFPIDHLSKMASNAKQSLSKYEPIVQAFYNTNPEYFGLKNSRTYGVDSYLSKQMFARVLENAQKEFFETKQSIAKQKREKQVKNIANKISVFKKLLEFIAQKFFSKSSPPASNQEAKILLPTSLKDICAQTYIDCMHSCYGLPKELQSVSMACVQNYLGLYFNYYSQQKNTPHNTIPEVEVYLKSSFNQSFLKTSEFLQFTQNNGDSAQYAQMLSMFENCVSLLNEKTKSFNDKILQSTTTQTHAHMQVLKAEQRYLKQTVS